MDELFFFNKWNVAIKRLPSTTTVFILQPEDSTSMEYLKRWIGAVFPGILYFSLFVHYQWSSAEHE